MKLSRTKVSPQKVTMRSGDAVRDPARLPTPKWVDLLTEVLKISVPFNILSWRSTARRDDTCRSVTLKNHLIRGHARVTASCKSSECFPLPLLHRTFLFVILLHVKTVPAALLMFMQGKQKRIHSYKFTLLVQQRFQPTWWRTSVARPLVTPATFSLVDCCFAWPADNVLLSN